MNHRLPVVNLTATVITNNNGLQQRYQVHLSHDIRHHLWNRFSIRRSHFHDDKRKKNKARKDFWIFRAYTSLLGT